MAENFEVLEGSNFELKLAGGLANSNFEFATGLQKNEKSLSAPTEDKEESTSSLKIDLALGQDQADDDSLPNANHISFGSLSQMFPQVSEKNETLVSGAQNNSGVEFIGDSVRDSASDFTPLAASTELSDDPSSVGNMPKSGDIKIDSLLHGEKWKTPTITYSFFDDAKGGPYYSNKYKNVREITGTMKSYLRHILEKVIEPLIKVDFVEVNDTKKNYGQIRYFFSTTPSVASTTYLSSSTDTAGDVKFNPKYTKDYEKGPGSYRYETLIHETLHALGMKHPGNYNGSSTGGQDGPFLANNLDHSGNSVLSYNRFSSDTPHNGVITPMTHDIKALQYLYGAKTHEAGDTVYKFESVSGYTVGGNFFGSRTQNIKQTIWDSAGIDKYDLSELDYHKSGYRFDLTDGGWITTQDAYMSASYTARGNNKRYKATALGTKTAFGATIEDLVASTSDDTIIANKAANTFSGYGAGKKAGNDIIIGANQSDTLDLSAYKSSDVTQINRGKDLVLDLGGNGSVTLTDYFAVGKDKRINILFDGANPTPVDPPTGPSPTDKTLVGTASDDRLVGAGGDDTIKGLAGNDTLFGKAGIDKLWGGGGNDNMHGGGGRDTIYGGGGNDIIHAGGGNDTINGGDGVDVLTGGFGADKFVYERINKHNKGDTITDFELSKDKFDLSTIFSDAKYGSTDVFGDYIQIMGVGTDTQIKVDRLGDTGNQFKTVATLTGVDAKSLNASHFVV